MVTDEPGASGAEEQQQAPPQQSDDMQSTMRALEGMGGTNSFDVSDSEKSSLLNEQVEAPQEQQPTETNPQANTEAPVNNEAPAADNVAAEESGNEPQTGDEAPAENTLDSEMFSMKADEKTEENKGEDLGFDSFEDFDNFLSESDFGITKDNIREKLPELIDSSKKFEEVSKQNENLNAVFDNMPEDLFNAVKAWSNAEDYRSVINSAPKIDFEKKFEDHDQKEMVDSYFKGKVSEEDWEEFNDSDGDPDVKEKVESYLELAKGKYDLSQSKFNHEKSTYEDNAKKTLAVRQQAFSKSRENFPEAFKDTPLELKEDFIADVDKKLQTHQSILDVFVNPDGTLKENAHEMMGMATGGKSVVVQQAKAIRNKMLSQAREEVLDNTPDSAQIQKTGDQGSQTNAQVEQQKADDYVASILGTQEKKTY
jgi:hypothetical protein